MWYTMRMRMFIKRFFAFPLILFLIFSFLSCCCLSGHAEAGISHQQVTEKTQRPSSNSHCDSHDPQDNHSGAKHQCECPKLQGTLANNFDALKTANVLLYSLSHQLVIDKISFVLITGKHNSSAGSSPPFSVSSVPLYIKNPSLRI